MKRLYAIVIALVMALTLCSCGGNQTEKEKYSDSEYLGTWVLTGYQVEDRTVAVEEHGSTELTLNADGTFTDVSEAVSENEDGEETYDKVTTKGTWTETETGFTTTDDIFTLEYKVKGDTATADYESTTLIRKRSK